MRKPSVFVVPLCPYCGKESKRVTGAKIYPHARNPALLEKFFYACGQCRAWVGCHPVTDVPLGRLANAALRRWKNRAHAAFDPLWRDGPLSRSQAYAWLATKLGIPCGRCHIGMFDVDECRKVEELARNYDAR